MKIRLELFRPTVRFLWATTYTFEPVVFEDLFIGRVAEECAITILADARALRSTWERLVEENPEGLRRANRRYLIRGVDQRHRIFHPKTILAVEPNRTRLLVGSGNLTMGGLLNGHELSVVFDASTPAGATAIAAWVEWVQALVDRLGDEQVTRRFVQLRAALPAVPDTTGDSLFVHNLHQPLLDQLVARAGAGPVERLQVMAPFWDRDLGALDRLRATFQPRSVDLLLCTDAKVDGEHLRALAGSPDSGIRVLQPRPGEFVHAKVVAVTRGDHSWVLSGSANCSGAALLRDADHGNAECGSLVGVPAELTERLFTQELALQAVSDDALCQFTWTRDDDDGVAEDHEPAMALAAAHWLEDGRIEICYGGSHSDGLHLMGLAQHPLAGIRETETFGSVRIGHTTAACDRGDCLAVALCDAAGVRLSGWIPVDDLHALMGTRRDARTSVPRDLQQQDMLTDAGRMLDYIDGTMDYSVLFDTQAPRDGASAPRDGASGDEMPAEHRGDLSLPWRPRHLGRLATSPDSRALDEILRDLATYRDRLPAVPTARSAAASRPSTEDDEALNDDGEAPDDQPVPSPDTQEEVERQGLAATSGLSPGGRKRLFNALHRRVAAAGNRRLFTEDTAAAIEFIARLVIVLHDLATTEQRRDYIAEDRLAALTEDLLMRLSGTAEAPGLLAVLAPEDRSPVGAAVRTRISSRFTDLVLALVAEHRPGQHARQVEWQPLVQHAVEIGLLDSDDDAVLDRLFWAATHTDPMHWERTLESRTGLSGVHVRYEGQRAYIDIPLHCAAALLTDPRVPRVLLEWALFAQSSGDGDGGTVTLAVPGDDTTRVALNNYVAIAKHNGVTLPTRVNMHVTTLRVLVKRCAALGELLRQA